MQSLSRNKKSLIYIDYFESFLKSREAMGVSPRTLEFYRERLSKLTSYTDYKAASREQIQEFLNSIPPNKYGLATRHCTYRALKTFYRWLHQEYGIPNLMERLTAPILSKPILPTLTLLQVKKLLAKAQTYEREPLLPFSLNRGFA